VKIDNQSRFADSVIQERLHIPLGEPLDTKELDKDIGQIYALGFLNLVTYTLTEENGQSGVIVHVTQDSRGTRFLEWGLDLFSDGSSTDANLRLAVLNTGLDKYGSEQRVMVQLGETPAAIWEIYKAVDPTRQLYLRPKVFWEKQTLDTFNDSGNILNTYSVNQWGGQIDILKELSHYAAISAGVRRFSGDADVEIGLHRLRLQLQRRRVRFQRRARSPGRPLYPEPRHAREHHVSEIEHRARRRRPVRADHDSAVRRVDHASTHHIGGFRYDITLDNDAPIYALFRAGGLFNLSGLEPNRVVGQNFGELLASYRYDLNEKGGLFPAFIGVSAEFGNAGEQKKDPFLERHHERQPVLREPLADRTVVLGRRLRRGRRACLFP
jgi:NTE family protein